MTDQCHTSALYRVGSGVSPSLTQSICLDLLHENRTTEYHPPLDMIPPKPGMSSLENRGNRPASLRVEPGEFPLLVYVPLVFLVDVDADFGRVVAPDGPTLELAEEAFRRGLGVLLARRHAGEDRDALVRSCSEERLAAELTGQPIDRLEPGPPQSLPLGLQGFSQTAVDVAGYSRRARAGRMVVGGDDQLGELVQQRVLRRSQELARQADRSWRRHRLGRQQRCGQRRRRGRDHLAARERVRHRFPFLNSSARYSQDRHASAMMVQVGFWHDALTWLEPSTTKRLRTSCDCWNWFRTEVWGSVPMRAVPSSWMDHPSVRISRSCPTTSIPAASSISRPVAAMSSAILRSLSENW